MTKDGEVRQFGALKEEPHSERFEKTNWVKNHSDRIYETTLAQKLMTLVLTKLSSLDPSVTRLAMKTTVKYITAIVFILSIFRTGGTWALNNTDQIELKGGLLSVKVERITLDDFLHQLENRTGIHFELDAVMGKTEISANFKGVPLLKGIERIIRQLNYAIVYRSDNEIDTVIILREGQDSEMPTRTETIEIAPRALDSSYSAEGFFGPTSQSVAKSTKERALCRDNSVHFIGPPGYEKQVDEGQLGSQFKPGEETPDLKSPEPPPPPTPPPGSSPTNPLKGPPGSEEQLRGSPFVGPPDLQHPPSAPP